MEESVITNVALAWKDNGNKMFSVYYTRNGAMWVMRDWARDEMDAYVKAMKKLKEQANG